MLSLAFFGSLAQSVEHMTVTHGVIGSSPIILVCWWVERIYKPYESHKLVITGSTPVLQQFLIFHSEEINHKDVKNYFTYY